MWTPACGKLEQLSCNGSTASHITKWSDWRVMQHVTQDNVPVVYSSWNVMAHGDAREGKWRGNWRMEWVASTLHTASEHGVSSITTADSRTSAAGSRLNWCPRQFKWTRPFRRKTKSGFCACAITFQLASNSKHLVGTPSCRSIPNFSWYFFLLMKCSVTSLVQKALRRLVTLNIYAHMRLIPYAVAILPPAFGVWIV